MKNKRDVQPHIAEKRQASARVKIAGWKAALQTGRVPQGHKDDFDVVQCEQTLLAGQEQIAQLRTITQDAELKNKQKRNNLDS